MGRKQSTYPVYACFWDNIYKFKEYLPHWLSMDYWLVKFRENVDDFIHRLTYSESWNQACLNVALKLDTETLDEVIVVAYSTAKKASFTGSASVMKAGELRLINRLI